MPGLGVGALMKQLITVHDGTRAVMAAMNDGMYVWPLHHLTAPPPSCTMGAPLDFVYLWPGTATLGRA